MIHCPHSSIATAAESVWKKALISIGRKELNEMIQEGKDIEMNCHFCNKNYNFTVEDLKRIIRECKR